MATYLDPLRRAERCFGDRLALVDADRSLTYGELVARCRRLAGAMARLGIQAGDRVAVHAENSVHFAELMLALPAAGIVVVPLNIRHALPELEAMVDNTGPRLLVTDRHAPEVSDALAREGLAILEEARGLETVNAPGLKGPELLAAVRDVEGLVVRSGTQVTREVIEAAPQLRVIGRAGIGVDNVDVPAATARGIAVVNTPEGNNITTAEHAIALLVALARHIPAASASMKAGKWEKSKFQGVELYNRTLGVVGLGNIGRIVAERARGLGMRVIAYDPYVSPEMAQKLDVELVELPELFERSDAVTVHVPKTKDTTGLLNAEAFRRMRRGVLIVNAARGGIVDEDALIEALNEGRVAGAALDVFVQEPPPAGHPLVQHERVICTPHLGGCTREAQGRIGMEIADILLERL